ncbi:hypothetical protein [Nocardioides sp. NPDC004968]|uniref:hypothetical protein n=1 Tax=Nocardioides sp. NPDC004968 TaxID=3155894 RepID=UPI0033B1CDE2
MTADDDHSDLRGAWARLNSRLRDLRQNLDFGDDTFHVEFAEKANRAANLAVHLDAALQLADRHLYGPAFTVVRSCLEHAVLDWLVYLGHTYVEHISGVSEEEWAQWKADREARADWTTGIVDWDRTRKGAVTIRRGGLFTEPDERGNREQLSIYYFLLEEYDGLVGKPADQQDDGFLTRDELRALATENQARWNVYLRWSALLDNLVVNDLVEEADRGRLGVHYRFLSTFAHPVSDNQRRLYGSRLDGMQPHYDHYASELVLLYIVAIAALELRNYHDGLKERLGAELSDAQGLDTDLLLIGRVTGHFWFIGTNPHPWDVHWATNRAAIQRVREGNSEQPSVPDPSSVPFPGDPLSRLISQHTDSWGRVIGAEYKSPWPRADATGLR